MTVMYKYYVCLLNKILGEEINFCADRAIRHRACSLRDMAQALLKAELDPEFERLCHEITQSRLSRGKQMFYLKEI